MTTLIDKKLIFKNIDVEDYHELFSKVGEQMINLGYAKSGYIEELNRREKSFPTGVPVKPIGVAIPHTEGQYINNNRLAVVTLKHPIDFEIMGSNNEKMPVSLVIFIGVHNGKEHMMILQKLIELIQNPSFVLSLLKTDTIEDLYNLLNKNLDNIGEEVK